MDIQNVNLEEFENIVTKDVFIATKLWSVLGHMIASTYGRPRNWPGCAHLLHDNIYMSELFAKHIDFDLVDAYCPDWNNKELYPNGWKDWIKEKLLDSIFDIFDLPTNYKDIAELIKDNDGRYYALILYFTVLYAGSYCYKPIVLVQDFIDSYEEILSTEFDEETTEFIKRAITLRIRCLGVGMIAKSLCDDDNGYTIPKCIKDMCKRIAMAQNMLEGRN